VPKCFTRLVPGQLYLTRCFCPTTPTMDWDIKTERIVWECRGYGTLIEEKCEHKKGKKKSSEKRIKWKKEKEMNRHYQTLEFFFNTHSFFLSLVSFHLSFYLLSLSIFNNRMYQEFRLNLGKAQVTHNIFAHNINSDNDKKIKRYWDENIFFNQYFFAVWIENISFWTIMFHRCLWILEFV